MKTEIVSFYSDIDNRTYYSDHAKRLRQNCIELNMPYDIRELPSTGSYRLNCLSKPKFILAMMEEKKKPFVWMDVDSVIHNELKIFDDKENVCDLIFAYQSIVPHKDVLKPKASPIYLNQTPIVYEFVKFWIDKCEENLKNNGPKVFDHEILLVEVLPKFIQKLRVGVLTMNYAIWPGTDAPNGMKPYITMGIADGDSKQKSLKEMGLSESNIKFNMVGNI